MTRQRNSKRVAFTWIAMGLILVGVIALTGAGRREPAPATKATPSAAAPDGLLTPGIAKADVDTLDLQLD
jgi:hypothetical protein